METPGTPVGVILRRTPFYTSMPISFKDGPREFQNVLCDDAKCPSANATDAPIRSVLTPRPYHTLENMTTIQPHARCEEYCTIERLIASLILQVDERSGEQGPVGRDA